MNSDELHWIPVAERLPDRKMRVLVVMLGYVWPGVFRPETKKKFVLKGTDSFSRVNFLENISHWMPMPAPPTDGK